MMKPDTIYEYRVRWRRKGQSWKYKLYQGHDDAMRCAGVIEGGTTLGLGEHLGVIEAEWTTQEGHAPAAIEICEVQRRPVGPWELAK